MDIYLSTYQKDYTWPKKARDPRLEQQPCPRCGCQSTVCPPSAEDDPNCQYLRRMQKKYPYLFEVLSQLPPDDRIAELYRDRLRTAETAAGMETPPPPAPAPPPQPRQEERPPQKLPPCPRMRIAAARKKAQGGEEEPAEDSELPSRVVTGNSEYQDTIGKTGTRIMMEKLLLAEENRCLDA